MFGKLWVSISCCMQLLRICLPFKSPLISPSFPESSNFRKSFVFCARSFRCTVESRWYCTISEAVLSRVGIMEVRSISVQKSVDSHGLGAFNTHFSMPISLSEICCRHRAPELHYDPWSKGYLRPLPGGLFLLRSPPSCREFLGYIHQIPQISTFTRGLARRQVSVRLEFRGSYCPNTSSQLKILTCQEQLGAGLAHGNIPVASPPSP